eukprot:922921-Amphidinium_carterae.4
MTVAGGNAGPRAGGRQRNLFPLPSPFSSQGAERAVCRKVQRRIQKRAHIAALAADCVWSLNELAGTETVSCSQCTSVRHAFVHEHIVNSIKRIGPCSAELTPEGALEALRGAAIYEELDSSTVEAYEANRVSLPAAGNKPVALEHLYGAGGPEFVRTFINECLHPADVATEQLLVAPRTPYMDENLRQSPRINADFLMRLADANMVQFAESAVESVGFFFVKKKEGKQRLIIDARRANCWFSESRSVSLATGSSLSQLRIPEGKNMYIGHYDIKDAFYHFQLPPSLRTYFGCPPIKAKYLGINSVNGIPVQPNDRVVPQLSVLPMGWVHALYWCQVLHTRICLGPGGLQSNWQVVDKHSAPEMCPVAFTIYVDNCIVFGCDAKAVSEHTQRAQQAVETAGLPTHEVQKAETHAQVLGWEFDGQTGHVGVKPEKAWKLIRALSWILDRDTVEPKTVEKLVGHLTFASLVSRPALSILRATYSFLNRFRGAKSARVWPSVKRELWIYRGMIPLMKASLRVQLCETVFCTDASGWGFAVCAKTCPQNDVGKAVKHNDRWAFSRNEEQVSLRTLASAQNSSTLLPESFEGEGWSVLVQHKWREHGTPHIVEGESCGILCAVEHACRNIGNFRKDVLVLTDSLTNALALSKGRSSAKAISRIARVLCALQLSSQINVRFRWLASECNPADAPSRGRQKSGPLFRRIADTNGEDTNNPDMQACAMDDVYRGTCRSEKASNNPDMQARARCDVYRGTCRSEQSSQREPATEENGAREICLPCAELREHHTDEACRGSLPSAELREPHTDENEACKGSLPSAEPSTPPPAGAPCATRKGCGGEDRCPWRLASPGGSASCSSSAADEGAREECQVAGIQLRLAWDLAGAECAQAPDTQALWGQHGSIHRMGQVFGPPPGLELPGGLSTDRLDERALLGGGQSSQGECTDGSISAHLAEVDGCQNVPVAEEFKSAQGVASFVPLILSTAIAMGGCVWPSSHTQKSGLRDGGLVYPLVCRVLSTPLGRTQPDSQAVDPSSAGCTHAAWAVGDCASPFCERRFPALQDAGIRRVHTDRFGTPEIQSGGIASPGAANCV